MENSNVSSNLLLALDTSAGRSSVAVWNGSALAFAADAEPGQQSRTLVPLIESVLAECGKTYQDMDGIACALGPGGFTSVRVGVATARSIALVTGKPLMGVSSLEVMAHAYGEEGDVVAMIDAHRQQFYAQRFHVNGTVQPISQPLLVEEAGLKALRHGAKLAKDPFDARDVARFAHAQWLQGKRDFPSEPLYIREPDAKLPTQ